ncbi:hypothetical protein KC928_13160 [Enterobacter cloacae]|uniref:hypothetical protein n=1 Tax=Enterobacter cloacae TaxID=550 RepID=UPI003315B3F9
MSSIDKQALNQEKIEWLNKLADMEYCKSNPGHWLMSLKDTNMLAKLALRSVALLDELEAADKAAASGIEWMKRCLSAEKRIAELEAVKCKLSDSKLLSLAKDIVENLVDTGASDPEYTQQYIDWTCKRIRAAAGKGE